MLRGDKSENQEKDHPGGVKHEEGFERHRAPEAIHKECNDRLCSDRIWGRLAAHHLCRHLPTSATGSLFALKVY